MRLTIDLSKKLFREYLTDLGYKKSTKDTKMSILNVYTDYISRNFNHNDLRNITANDIRVFLKYLERAKGERTLEPYSKRFKLMVLRVVQQFFKALYIKDKLLIDPSTNIHYVPNGETHKKIILTEDEMRLFLDSIECKTYIQRRDRALFELMYSSGLRVGEVVNIRKSDINFSDSTVFISLGKFSKDRVVPVSDTALYFIAMFSRRKRRDSYLFVSTNGTRKLTTNAVNKRLHKYLELTGIDKEGITCHSIRHSTASHLLDRGADIRYVQTLLGHESIETTVVYTHLLTDSIKKIYKSYHPRENNKFVETDTNYLNDIKKLEKAIDKQRLRK